MLLHLNCNVGTKGTFPGLKMSHHFMNKHVVLCFILNKSFLQLFLHKQLKHSVTLTFGLQENNKDMHTAVRYFLHWPRSVWEFHSQFSNARVFLLAVPVKHHVILTLSLQITQQNSKSVDMDLWHLFTNLFLYVSFILCSQMQEPFF